MKRRQLITMFGVGMATVAGCVGPLSGDSSDSRSTKTTNAPMSPTTVETPSESPTRTSHSKSGVEGGCEPLGYRLRIIASEALQVRIVLTYGDTDKQVYAKQHSLTAGEEINLDEHLSCGASYELVLEMNGGRIAEMVLGDHAGVILSIQPDGTVEIEDQVEI